MFFLSIFMILLIIAEFVSEIAVDYFDRNQAIKKGLSVGPPKSLSVRALTSAGVVVTGFVLLLLTGSDVFNGMAESKGWLVLLSIMTGVGVQLFQYVSEQKKSNASDWSFDLQALIVRGIICGAVRNFVLGGFALLLIVAAVAFGLLTGDI